MIKIGITGGIGSGKSLVSKIIETLGYTVFNSDFEAKVIINTNANVRSELIEVFGASVYTDTGLNKDFLAKKIFSDPSLREKINQIVHPRVREAFNNMCATNAEGLVFNEAAILIETGAYSQFDKIILVTAPEALRITRVMARDGASEADVKARIASQWNDTKKAEFADVVIENDEIQPLLIQIENFIDQVISS
jgi:dephospho-CoA kinase